MDTRLFQPLIRRFPALARSASHRVCNTKVSLESSTSSRPYGNSQAVLATGNHGSRSGSLEAPPLCRSPGWSSYLPVELFSQPWASLRLAPIISSHHAVWQLVIIMVPACMHACTCMHIQSCSYDKFY